MRIQLSDAELEAHRLHDESLKIATDAIHLDGYVVLGGVVDHDALDAMRSKLDDDTAELLRRIEAKGESDELVGQLSVPMARSAEHVHSAVVTNPWVIQVTHAILGDGVHNHFYNCNTNMPGSQSQPLHRDAGHLEPDPLNPVISVIVNISPVDVNESNGATEIWPGTHKIPGPTRVPDQASERRRLVSPPVRMVTSMGDAVLRDPRLWHRGMPNPGSEIRHMVAMVHSKWFYERHTTIRVPQATLRSFDDHVLTTRVERVPDDYDYLGESLHL